MSMSMEERFLGDSMTVFQLIEALKELDQEAKVVFHYNYGDHWNTEVADTVSTVETGAVSYSGYHNKLKITDPYVNEGDEIDYNPVSVIVLGLQSVETL